MSSATLVPETRDLTGDDAIAVLRRCGWGTLLRDAFRRLRVADGFSHVRSLAYLVALVAIQALIALVGLASVLHKGSVSRAIDAAIRKAVPGPAGHVLTTAVTQANHSVSQHHYGAIIVGLVGSLFTATTAMGQLERGLNRLYGVEQDRPAAKKYALAFVFALSAGTLTTLAFVCLTFGNEIFRHGSTSMLSSGWSIVRWPLGVVLIAAAVTLLFRWTPRRRQPQFSWLMVGSAISVLLWVASTAALGLFFRSSSSFGSTYGPLAGVVALLFWSLMSSFSVFYGGAVAAQLEAIRVGSPAPQDSSKVAQSNPGSDTTN